MKAAKLIDAFYELEIYMMKVCKSLNVSDLSYTVLATESS